MPVILDDEPSGDLDDDRQTGQLPFPPVTKAHILHCSFHYWHPKFRGITPKARVVPLTKPFVRYLRADGIVLPDEDTLPHSADSNIDNDSESDNEDEDDEDVSAAWSEVHTTIRNTIAELGGNVVPKLNWSAPKDATWMNANTMACRTPNDIYLLLKSSDFVSHDLEHAFDDCTNSSESSMTKNEIPYVLALRKTIEKISPSLEFRCFVRGRRLLAICQRDLNHYSFLAGLQDRFRSLIMEFFSVRLQDQFPDDNFVFDVYIPPPHDRVWLIDFNPWAPRTDPLLYGWLELLTMDDPPEVRPQDSRDGEFVRLSLVDRPVEDADQLETLNDQSTEDGDASSDSDSNDIEEADEELWLPEIRLIRKEDPEAYNFSTPQYSAHKLPKDVVDASASGEGLREFARDWQEILAKRQAEDQKDE